MRALDGSCRTFLHVQSTVKILTCYEHTHNGVLDFVITQACRVEPKHYGLVTGGLMSGNFNAFRGAGDDAIGGIALHMSACVVFGNTFLVDNPRGSAT